MKKRLLKLVAVLLALAPMAFAAACGQQNDSATGGNPPDIVEENPSEENPPEEENPSEETPSEENPPEENPPEEEKPSEEQKPTKPSLPGGLVDGGNFQGNV